MKSNKLIAEFMGMKPHEHDYGIMVFRTESSGNDICNVSDLEYHTSWDWLMPVVAKIESLEEDESWTISIELNSVIVWMHSPYMKKAKKIVKVTSINKREATYRAVVEFIKEYNKTK